MQRVDFGKPGELKKLVVAIALGVVAIAFLYWTFVGFGSSSNTTKPRVAASPTPAPRSAATNQPTSQQQPVEIKNDLGNQLQPVVYQWAPPPTSEARRNIFAFYEPPPPPVKVEVTPTPTPTPTPPVLLSSLSPANVYAKTGDFTLEVAGDRFTPDLRINIDGRDLQSRFKGPQQLSATVPAALIAAAGQRQVMLRTPDGKLYSNPVGLNVSQPPTPNYTYIGIIGTQRHVDTAILQERGSKEIMNVQRGDVLNGRFRVVSISEKEIVFMDTNLKIRHPLAMSAETDKAYNPMQRPTPKVESEDDEPL